MNFEIELEYGEMCKFKKLGIDITECKIIELGCGGTRYVRMDDMLKQISANRSSNQCPKPKQENLMVVRNDLGIEGTVIPGGFPRALNPDKEWLRLIMLNAINNATGEGYSEEELEAIDLYASAIHSAFPPDQSDRIENLQNVVIDCILLKNKIKDQRDKLLETLKQAAQWFGEYADHHQKKGDTEKCMRNAARQTICLDAIKKVEGGQ
jgi:hypothetical protein